VDGHGEDLITMRPPHPLYRSTFTCPPLTLTDPTPYDFIRKKSPLPDWLRTWEVGNSRIFFTLNLEEEAPLENSDVMKLHSTF
jgi:hypothetical protein